MAYHIKKPSSLDSDVTVYFAGETQWTYDFSKRKIYSTQEKINALIDNSDGKNGGFKNITIVSE